MSLLRARVSPSFARSFTMIAMTFAAMTFAGTSASAASEGDPTGACCIGPDGACAIMTQAQCQDMSGFYRGDGSDCSVCSTTGRCCINVDGVVNCEVLTIWECATTTGWMLYSAPGDCNTTCGQIGACCYGDECLETLETICTLFYSGTFLGEGTTCDDCDGLPPQTGMCCIDDGKSGYFCMETTFDDCVFNQGGEFYGVGVLCDDLYFCGDFSEAGACCLPSGGCVYTTFDICEFDFGGVFQGEGIWCIDADCSSDEPGACCLNGGTTCELLSSDACDFAGGVFAGPGSVCDFNSCPELLGTCCLQNPDGTSYCLELTIDDCFDTEGASYWSIGSAPCSSPCPQFGACCTDDGFCYTTQLSTCVNFYQGTFMGLGTTCFDIDGDAIPDGCEAPGDVNGDGVVNVTDLLMVIGAWGVCGTPCPADIAPPGPPQGDGVVNVSDLLLVIGNWG